MALGRLFFGAAASETVRMKHQQEPEPTSRRALLSNQVYDYLEAKGRTTLTAHDNFLIFSVSVFERNSPIHPPCPPQAVALAT